MARCVIGLKEDNCSQNREEQMSEKSEGASVKSENPARIEDIFDWIDGIPLSKTTKNLARDFSDAVLMSEILKFYYPSLVRSHNYIPANSVQGKKDNWFTLNRKVLSKIDMQLTSEAIDQLAHSQVGAIDKVLGDFREKQMAIKASKPEVVDRPGSAPEETAIISEVPEEPATSSTPISDEQSFFSKFIGAIKNFFLRIIYTLLAVICFWRWFSREPVQVQEEEIEEPAMEEIDEQLRNSYDQALQELRMKADVIKTLCHKVAFLEGSMKLKDMKINALSNQIDRLQEQHQQQHQQHIHSQHNQPEERLMHAARQISTATIPSKLQRKKPRVMQN